MEKLKQLSRYLSLLLRHKPEDLILDKEGFTTVESILKKLNISKEQLDWIVTNNDKKRFSYSKDNLKIRANQGHSNKLNVKITFKKWVPSLINPILYHGTDPNSVLNILKSGLVPMNRTHVHLSKDKDTANKVGSRKNKKPVILIIDAIAAFLNGVTFYESDNGVILSNNVPSKYIKIEKV